MTDGAGVFHVLYIMLLVIQCAAQTFLTDSLQGHVSVLSTGTAAGTCTSLRYLMAYRLTITLNARAE